MKLWIYIEKVLIVLHIRSLDKESLANRVYMKQKEENWPGLAKETQKICEELNIEDCNLTLLSKKEYKIILTKACHIQNETTLRATDSEVKCYRIKEEPYGKKSYTQSKNIEDSRKWLRTCFGLLPFAENFRHDRWFVKTDWLCRCRISIQEEGHITSGNCQFYGGLRNQFGDLEDDENLVKFFQAVLDKREELEDEDRTRQSLTAAVDASSTPGNSSRTSQPGDLSSRADQFWKK